MTQAITKRQREVLDHLSEKGAFSSAKASMVYGIDSNVAEKLAGNASSTSAMTPRAAKSTGSAQRARPRPASTSWSASS